MDGDRAAVYAAELAAFDGTDLETLQTFGEIADLTMALTTGAWWPGPRVVVRPARRDARSSSTRCEIERSGDVATVRLAAEQLTLATAAHELGHALAGSRHGHDGVFRAAYLDVVAVITNADHRERRRELHVVQLSEAFEAAGLPVGGRRWPAPPESIAGPIAL